MPNTITVDLSGGPHGSTSLGNIPLIDGEAPGVIEYQGVVYRLLAKVPGRQRRLYLMQTVIVKDRTPSNGVKTEEEQPAAKAKPKKTTSARKAVKKEEPSFSG